MILSRRNTDCFKEWIDTANSAGATVLIDKDISWTSFDVVAKIRNASKVKKVGHAGTLDPLATGLLILCLGKATKTIESYQGLPKEYIAEIKLGATTVTDDSEGDEENIFNTDNISEADVRLALNKYIGEIEQIPPQYSARKVDGKRMYELARKNIQVEAKPTKVEIYSIDILNIEMPVVKVKINCSKGTYIRSLARDIGKDLLCGGYLLSLRRTKIGDYCSDDALTIKDFIGLINKKESANDENLS